MKNPQFSLLMLASLGGVTIAAPTLAELPQDQIRSATPIGQTKPAARQTIQFKDLGSIPATFNHPPSERVVPESSPSISPSIGTTQSNSFQILSPTSNAVLDVPAATVVLRFPVNTSIELRVNGTLIDPSLIGRTETDEKTKLVTQTWYGVSLKSGSNRIEATATIAGKPESSSTIVTVRGGFSQLKVETREAQINADGKSIATVRGSLLDEAGNRSNQTAIVTLSSSLGEWVGDDAKPDQPGFQVEAKTGEFTAQLRAPLKAGIAQIRATANGLEGFSQLPFKTDLRPGIVAGVANLRIGARGLDFHDRLRDFMPPLGDNHTELSTQAALFATGKVGDWLFTGAFNSDRPLNRDAYGQNRLFRSGDQFPDLQYPIYGDSSTTTNLTPSIDHIFARLERSPNIPGADPDYVMWGDYNTEELSNRSQQFTAIGRQLHGAKLNYNLGDLQVTGLFANNIEGFQRDTIAPDGTSGYYLLSQRILVPGSESLYLELEELERPGTIVKREQLQRGSDYEIDYDRGTILFKEAILRTAVGDVGQVLRRQIVASYQFESDGKATKLYGGRLRYHINRDRQNPTWIGATYLKENKGDRNFDLYGVDGLISLGTAGKLVGEYAHSSNNSSLLGLISGSALRLEADGKFSDAISGRAYYRQADSGFANLATESFTPGQTRYGAELQGKVSPTTNLKLGYDHERNQGTAPRPIITLGDLLEVNEDSVEGQRVDNDLTTITAGLQQKLGRATVDLDWINRQRTDRLNSDRSGNSSQLRSKLSYPLTNTITFQALNETTLSNRSDAIYSDRTQVGLDWQIVPGIKLGLNQHWFGQGQFAGQNFTTLDLNGDYALGKSTTLTGRYSVLNGINGVTGQGAIGLKQRWQVSPGFNLDFAYERIVGGLFGKTAAGDRTAQPVAIGQGISTLGIAGGDSFSIGGEYTANPDWKASARFEHRRSNNSPSTNLSASVTGKLSPALSALARFNYSQVANQNIQGLGPTTNLRVGLAYRNPLDDKFNALLRYEYRRNPALVPEELAFGSGSGSADHLLAFETIYSPNWRWELYGKLGWRRSTSYLAEDYVGGSNTVLGQLRATYKFHDRLDLGAEARWIRQGGYSENGLLVEGGYYLTPNLRVAAGYTFGKVSDRDFDGTRSASGPYFGVTMKLNELFNGFGLQRPANIPLIKPKLMTGTAPQVSGSESPSK
jgi:hypothetical protein